MKNQLREDINMESSVAPTIEVLYAEDGVLVGWAPIVEDDGIYTSEGIIDLSDVTVQAIRIKK